MYEGDGVTFPMFLMPVLSLSLSRHAEATGGHQTKDHSAPEAIALSILGCSPQTTMLPQTMPHHSIGVQTTLIKDCKSQSDHSERWSETIGNVQKYRSSELQKWNTASREQKNRL